MKCNCILLVLVMLLSFATVGIFAMDQNVKENTVLSSVDGYLVTSADDNTVKVNPARIPSVVEQDVRENAVQNPADRNLAIIADGITGIINAASSTSITGKIYKWKQTDNKKTGTVFNPGTFATGTFAMAQDIIKDNYWQDCDEKGITPSSDPAINMVNVEKSCEGCNGSDLKASGEWCAAFQSTVAKINKQGDAIPYSAGVKGLFDGIKKAGGTVIYSHKTGKGFENAKPGDIVVYKLDGCEYAHVELVSKKPSNGKITSIGGNTGNANSWKKRVVKEHSWNKSYVAYIIRPAYKNNTLSYVDRCKSTATYVSLKAVYSTSIMTQPCPSTIDASSKVVRKTSKNETFTAVAIVKNTNGEYFYKISADKDGKSGFIPATSANYVGVPKNVISGNAKLATYTPKKGNPVTISGKITSKVKICTVRGALIDAAQNTQTATVSVNGKSFSIKGSKIDKNLQFAKLKKGAGTLQLTVVVSVPYVAENKLVKNNVKLWLDPITFTVK